MNCFKRILLAGLLMLAGHSALCAESGFTSLFDGETLNGWVFVGKGGCRSEDGILICPKESAGDLFTEKEYANFVLRLDYKLQPGGNNGVGIRCPAGAQKEAFAYAGMEIQMLDDKAPKHAHIKPWQFNGSVYN